MSQGTQGVASPQVVNPKHEQARRQIELLLERDKDKDAYSQAKALFRLDTSEATRRLLERAYLLRIQALVRAGMPTAAKEIAVGLLTLGVTNESILEPLVSVLPRLGLGDRALQLSARLNSADAQSRLALHLADQAVLHPEQASPLTSELRETAGKVRAALTAILAGNEATAAELLDGIPRQSPYADWKLFARGLAAYYRQDAEQMAANWDRLQASRAPQSIAAALCRSMPVKGSDSAGTAAPTSSSARLETHVFGEPVLAHLVEIHKSLAQGDWTRLLQVAKIVYGSFRRTGLELGTRLTAILLEPLVNAATNKGQDEGERLILAFTKVAEPLPIDPRWNRLWALVWTRVGGRFEFSLKYWRAYLTDINQMAAESADRRQLLSALVWEEIGDIYAEESDAALDDDWGDDDGEPFIAKAVASYEESLKLRPQAKTVYLKLAELCDDEECTASVTEVTRRMLAAFPNDFDVAERAFRLAATDGDAPFMLAAAQQTRRLKPLDPRTFGYERSARVALARQHALEKRWDEARRELESSADPSESPQSQVLLTAQRAAVEFKANKTEAAEQFIAQGLAVTSDAAEFCLAMAMEAERFRLKKPQRNRCEAALTKALGRKKSGATASALAKLVLAQRSTGVSSRFLDRYDQQVLEYLEKCMRTKFSEAEFEAVVTFHDTIKESPTQFEHFVRRAARAHRDSAFFCYHMAQVLFSSPDTFPPRALASARDQLEKAARLASRPGDRHAALLTKIREFQNLLAKQPNTFADFFRYATGSGGRQPNGGFPDDDDAFEDFTANFFSSFFKK